MNDRAFTFEKLGITTKDWDIIQADNQCGYTFSTPVDGVLFLRSAGIMNKEVVHKQIQFIENYHLELNKRIVNFKSVLVWDVSDLFGYKSLFTIKKHLSKVSIDVVLMVPGKMSYRFLLSLWKRNESIRINMLPQSTNEALAFAKRIKSTPDESGNYSGRFAEIWSHSRKTKKQGKKIYRYIALPEWQYESQNKTLRSSVSFFDNKTILYEIQGHVKASDVQALQQKIVEISDHLEIDLQKYGFYIIFDVRKVKSIESDARKLMRNLEQHQHHLSEGVVVIANRMVNYFFGFRKRLHPDRYDHWHTAQSIKSAFSIIENKKIIEKAKAHSKPSKAQPAAEYQELKRQFEKLQTDYNILNNNYNRSVSNTRKVLSFINAGDFMMTPFKARYDDESIEGEVYNTFAILHNDLQKNKSFGIMPNFELGFTYSNIENIINAINQPALIYSNKKILFVNESFANLVGSSSSELKDQPISVFVHAFDISRVERYLEEDNPHSSFECDIYNDLDRTITVTMNSEFMLVDGVYSQMVFINAKFKAINQDAEAELKQSNRLKSNALGSVVTRSMAGVVGFYLVMLKSINQKLLNQFISPETYNPQLGVHVLTLLSGFVRRIFDGASFYQSYPDKMQLFSLKETIDNIADIFSNYLKLNRNQISFNLTGNVPRQKIGLSMHSFWVEALLIRVLHLITDATKGDVVELNCRAVDEKNIEISISDNGANLNLFSLEKVGESSSGAITITEIDQLLKREKGNLKLDSTLESGNKISMTLPITDRGAGYDGALMDLSFHNILIYDAYNEFENYKLALSDTGVNLVHSRNLQKSVKALEKQKVSIILLDMSIPEIDISLFVSRVKNEHERIPIIGFTKDSSHKGWKKNIQSGVDLFLSKPIDAKELKENIKLFLS